jgi:glycine/D-amino acid oxidase-like deaminating enzyme
MFVSTGFGGGGFAFSPVAGKIMSDLVVDGETSLDISPYSVARLAGSGDFETEAQDPV